MSRPTGPGTASLPQGRSRGSSGSTRRAQRTSQLIAGQTPRGKPRCRDARPCDVPRAVLGKSACGGTRCRMEFATLGQEDPCARPYIPIRRTKLRSRRACNAHRQGHLPCRYRLSPLIAIQMHDASAPGTLPSRPWSWCAPRTLQGMARVRSGQAAAWPLVPDRRGCRATLPLAGTASEPDPRPHKPAAYLVRTDTSTPRRWHSRSAPGRSAASS